MHDIEYHRSRYIEQALDDIRALQQLKSQGKIRFFGVTAYPIAVLKDVLARVEVDTVLCHNHYTLSDTQLLELVPLAAEKQVCLIAAALLGSSLLTEKAAAQWHPASEADRDVVRPLMTQFQDFDWADEGKHVHIGREWTTHLYVSFRAAARNLVRR